MLERGKAESDAKQMQQKIKYIEIIFRHIFLLRTSLIVGMAQVMWPTAPPLPLSPTVLALLGQPTAMAADKD